MLLGGTDGVHPCTVGGLLTRVIAILTRVGRWILMKVGRWRLKEVGGCCLKNFLVLWGVVPVWVLMCWSLG